MTVLVFDIETVADPELLRAHGAAIASMARRREQDVDTFGALCPPLARVVAVAFHDVEAARSHVVYDAGLVGYAGGTGEGPCDDEPAVLGEVARIASKYARIVTYAGRGFDLPVLVHRARIAGVVVPPIFNRALHQKPWESDPHLDLQAAVSFGGATGRFPLSAYTIAYGAGNPKASGDGGDVARLVAERRAAELVAYARGDVEATAALYRRWVGA